MDYPKSTERKKKEYGIKYKCSSRMPTGLVVQLNGRELPRMPKALGSIPGTMKRKGAGAGGRETRMQDSRPALQVCMEVCRLKKNDNGGKVHFHKGIKSIRNGNYLGKTKRQFFLLHFFKIQTMD